MEEIHHKFDKNHKKEVMLIVRLSEMTMRRASERYCVSGASKPIVKNPTKESSSYQYIKKQRKSSFRDKWRIFFLNFLNNVKVPINARLKFSLF